MRIAALALFALTANAQPPKLTFDVSTIKLSDPDSNGTYVNNMDGKLECKNLTLNQLIIIAYHLRKEQVSGGPAWVRGEHFDIQAKYEPSTDKQPLTDAQRQERQHQFEERLQSLLADRFQLIAKLETREMALYTLVAAKGGPKLKPEKDTTGNHQGTSSRRGSMTGTSSGLENIADGLSFQVDKPVLDKTGIIGRFDYQLNWTPDPPAGTAAPDISGPSLFTALQEQLGLKLESQKVMMPFVVIERAEKPSAN